jgi:hypothetical protein
MCIIALLYHAGGRHVALLTSVMSRAAVLTAMVMMVMLVRGVKAADDGINDNAYGDDDDANQTTTTTTTTSTTTTSTTTTSSTTTTTTTSNTGTTTTTSSTTTSATTTTSTTTQTWTEIPSNKGGAFGMEQQYMLPSETTSCSKHSPTQFHAESSSPFPS